MFASVGVGEGVSWVTSAGGAWVAVDSVLGIL